MATLATHRYGHRVLLAMLAPDNPRLWPPSIMDVVAPPPKHAHASAGGGAASESDEDDDMGIVDDELDDAEAGDNTSNKGDDDVQNAAVVMLGASKKAPRQRQLELLTSGAIADAMLQCAAANAGTWLCNGPASNVIEALAVGGSSGATCFDQRRQPAGPRALHELPPTAGVVSEAAADGGLAALHHAVAEACRGEEGAVEGPLVDFFGSRALRRVVLASGAGDGCEAAVMATNALWAAALKGHCARCGVCARLRHVHGFMQVGWEPRGQGARCGGAVGCAAGVQAG